MVPEELKKFRDPAEDFYILELFVMLKRITIMDIKDLSLC